MHLKLHARPTKSSRWQALTARCCLGVYGLSRRCDQPHLTPSDERRCAHPYQLYDFPDRRSFRQQAISYLFDFMRNPELSAILYTPLLSFEQPLPGSFRVVVSLPVLEKRRSAQIVAFKSKVVAQLPMLFIVGQLNGASLLALSQQCKP